MHKNIFTYLSTKHRFCLLSHKSNENSTVESQLNMLVRSFGFCVDSSVYPKAMDFSHLFDALANHGIEPLDKKGIYHGCATKITHKYKNQKQKYWAGIIVKARDAKSFNKLVKSNGKIQMTSDQLQEGKIAESTYFLASELTGKGLVACYQGSPGMPLLGWALQKVFKSAQIRERSSALESASSKDKKKIANSYLGKIKLFPLIKEGTLKDLLSEFKKVGKVEFKISEVKSNRPFFRASFLKSSTRTEKYLFEPNFSFTSSEIDALVKEIDNPETIATIEGKVAGGASETISSIELKNKQIFGSIEYDEVHGSFIFNHDTSSNNVHESPVISWLILLLNNARINGVINTP